MLLHTLDQEWTAHLGSLDNLRGSIHLLSYGQKDPLNEYKHEAFMMFKRMIDSWHNNFLFMFFASEKYQDRKKKPPPKRTPPEKAIIARSRNEECSCGSGKRYKHCHGKIQE